jgi:hypothetical protein
VLRHQVVGAVRPTNAASRPPTIGTEQLTAPSISSTLCRDVPIRVMVPVIVTGTPDASTCQVPVRPPSASGSDQTSVWGDRVRRPQEPPGEPGDLEGDHPAGDDAEAARTGSAVEDADIRVAAGCQLRPQERLIGEHGEDLGGVGLVAVPGVQSHVDLLLTGRSGRSVRIGLP